LQRKKHTPHKLERCPREFQELLAQVSDSFLFRQSRLVARSKQVEKHTASIPQVNLNRAIIRRKCGYTVIANLVPMVASVKSGSIREKSAWIGVLV
jgi:hypothetical protein